MNMKVPLIFLWVGFVSAISFMEAWLKFTAPGVTLTTGLAIGQIVFGALNKVELVIALIIGLLAIVDKSSSIPTSLPFFLAVLILLVQTFYVLPVLSSRIDIYLSGKIPKESGMHAVYVLLEVLKVVTLTGYGLIQFKNENI